MAASARPSGRPDRVGAMSSTPALVPATATSGSCAGLEAWVDTPDTWVFVVVTEALFAGVVTEATFAAGAEARVGVVAGAPVVVMGADPRDVLSDPPAGLVVADRRVVVLVAAEARVMAVADDAPPGVAADDAAAVAAAGGRSVAAAGDPVVVVLADAVAVAVMVAGGGFVQRITKLRSLPDEWLRTSPATTDVSSSCACPTLTSEPALTIAAV